MIDKLLGNSFKSRLRDIWLNLSYQIGEMILFRVVNQFVLSIWGTHFGLKWRICVNCLHAFYSRHEICIFDCIFCLFWVLVCNLSQSEARWTRNYIYLKGSVLSCVSLNLTLPPRVAMCSLGLYWAQCLILGATAIGSSKMYLTRPIFVTGKCSISKLNSKSRSTQRVIGFNWAMFFHDWE